MRNVIDTKGMDRQAWLALRRQGLGGSDAATLVGMNPYHSLLSLYANKKGLLDEPDKPAMRVGRALESTVARMWQEQEGKRCYRVRGMFVDRDVDYFRANIDRKVVGENAGLEVKVAGPWTKLDLDGDQPPALYQCQCQWYMMVCGFDKMYLAVLSLNNYQLYRWTLHRDQPLIDALRRAGARFWQDHVLPGAPPPPDGSEPSARAVAALAPDAQPGVASLDGQAAAIHKYQALGGQIEALKRDKDQLGQVLRQALGGCAVGEGGGYRVSCVSQQRESLDGQALKRALPLVYGQFAQTKPVSVLRVAALKGGVAHVD